MERGEEGREYERGREEEKEAGQGEKGEEKYRIKMQRNQGGEERRLSSCFLPKKRTTGTRLEGAMKRSEAGREDWMI